jgi:hypothetical protein
MLPVPAMTSPAWAASCEDGSRDSAAAIAETGEWGSPVDSVQTPNYSDKATITLRYSDTYKCAWTLIQGLPHAEAWIDRSSDGGLTWDSELGKRTIQKWQSNTYTAAYSAGVPTPFSVRACGRASWEEQVDDGLLLPRISGRPIGRAPEYERRWSEPACTNWFPGSVVIDEKEIDWTVETTFFGPDGEDIPLRIGGWDGPLSKGFGVAHIEDEHGEVPDYLLIQRALDDCKPAWQPGRGTWGCFGEGIEVHYSPRTDTRAPDGRPMGIVTAFVP